MYERHHDYFSRKTYGRIFIRSAEDAARVVECMRQIDAWEVDGYMPKDIFYVWDGEGAPPLIYTHKFEMDITALTALCWRHGVWVWCVTGYHEDDLFSPFPALGGDGGV